MLRLLRPNKVFPPLGLQTVASYFALFILSPWFGGADWCCRNISHKYYLNLKKNQIPEFEGGCCL